MITDVEQTIRDYMANVIHLSLATVSGDKPWVCELHFAYDDDLNLYFRSEPSRRHSQELVANPNVAGDIIELHGPADKPRGVYFEGTAQVLTDADEQNVAYLALNQRFSLAKVSPEDTFYKISVQTFYLFDTRESKPSQKYTLEWNRG